MTCTKAQKATDNQHEEEEKEASKATIQEVHKRIAAFQKQMQTDQAAVCADAPKPSCPRPHPVKKAAKALETTDLTMAANKAVGTIGNGGRALIKHLPGGPRAVARWSSIFIPTLISTIEYQDEVWGRIESEAMLSNGYQSGTMALAPLAVTVFMNFLSLQDDVKTDADCKEFAKSLLIKLVFLHGNITEDGEFKKPFQSELIIQVNSKGKAVKIPHSHSNSSGKISSSQKAFSDTNFSVMTRCYMMSNRSLDYEVRDKESSIAFLEKSPFRQSSEPMSNESLVLTILHITQYTGIPRTAIEGLRAVALILEDSIKTRPEEALSVQQLMDSLSTSLSAQLVADLSNTLSSHVIAAISPQVVNILTASETLKSNVDAIAKFKAVIEENSKEDNSSASAAATCAELAADAVLSSITDVKNAIDSLTPPPSAVQPATSKSYSAVTQQSAQTLAPISAALIRVSTRDQQILFDPALGQALFVPDITSVDIATRMKLAFTATELDDMPIIQIKAITHLCNGGLIVELTSTEAATWIRVPEN
ncbi:uncharacterized protein EDB91DRAFT_1312874 [Suillus paluster]|uniref:uncharacterized protein n=1 Tax=Suillus paluster TaxID=48578 RepID=UPI001B86BD6D|nr:uncharacterized protein EDB91DRAFT_1312874 [Suillus paluster]KAG1728961.1 hypothetical protein EDB91DRAFT_1312874 [Suillus paluster]